MAYTYVVHELVDHAVPGAVGLHGAVQSVWGLVEVELELEHVPDLLDQLNTVAVVVVATGFVLIHIIQFMFSPINRLLFAFEDKRSFLQYRYFVKYTQNVCTIFIIHTKITFI